MGVHMSITSNSQIHGSTTTDHACGCSILCNQIHARRAGHTQTRKLLTLSGFNASSYAGHRYRIGAATTAAEANLSSWLIKTLGRWSSDCYERYINLKHLYLPYQEYQPCWPTHPNFNVSSNFISKKTKKQNTKKNNPKTQKNKKKQKKTTNK